VLDALEVRPGHLAAALGYRTWRVTDGTAGLTGEPAGQPAQVG
jgi:hypothetical protein